MVVEHNKKQAQTDGKVHTEYIFVQKKVPFMVLGIVDICFFFNKSGVQWIVMDYS